MRMRTPRHNERTAGADASVEALSHEAIDLAALVQKVGNDRSTMIVAKKDTISSKSIKLMATA